ncbi:MAG: hypothetical protein KIT56_00240 [Gammaproteobacteria bacterium]|nr:hypothetical protein [Gammaproteobacteria bacterium]
MITDHILALQKHEAFLLRENITVNATTGDLAYLREERPIINFSGQKTYSDNTATYKKILKLLDNAIELEKEATVQPGGPTVKGGPSNL